nr:hypothetical protein [Candidatus Hakubella thermalkaliphila]
MINSRRNMASGHSYIDRVDRKARHLLSFFYRLDNGLRRFGDIYYYPLPQAVRRS